MCRGSLQHLEDLNVAGNPFSLKKGKDMKVPQTFKQFFCSVLALKSVDLSNTKLPPSAIKYGLTVTPYCIHVLILYDHSVLCHNCLILAILCWRELLLGLSANVNRPSVNVNLSCNEMKSEGGLVLGGCIAELQNVHGLDLTDNGKLNKLNHTNFNYSVTDLHPWNMKRL